MTLKRGFPLILLLAAAFDAQARDIDFNYVEGNVGMFDLDIDESFTDGTDSLNFKSDDDVSYDAAGAWQPFKGSGTWTQGLHLFAALGLAEQDLKLSATIGGVTATADGSVDIFRARGGVGYGFDISPQWNLYGRLTWDYVELQDISVGGFDADDQDDDGIGGEIGARWLVTDALELQLYGRYTDVGTVSNEDFESDDDTYLGAYGRWYFADRWALQAGGEWGDTKLYNAGVRFDF